ncbi:TPA: hypothetical protein DEO28_04530 [Candidatus Dependentiae bacterium]|nr:MAG: hypothetical protein UR14_C0002G0024 [candidate division TM6 bacterium GW2011_GWE2_31_21]KKP53821.1 MAG: hypothetical protein UR43_C0002G0024 [candidate division TM6 bacterium GW2011_GWF2_33_332]HBS47601.1 hypothetical protein [Candidatus Dependentiae bacterium]HBZ73750.1 hypothetical protein [Candidatus Dependentiae bacterium]
MFKKTILVLTLGGMFSGCSLKAGGSNSSMHKSECKVHPASEPLCTFQQIKEDMEEICSSIWGDLYKLRQNKEKNKVDRLETIELIRKQVSLANGKLTEAIDAVIRLWIVLKYEFKQQNAFILKPKYDLIPDYPKFRADFKGMIDLQSDPNRNENLRFTLPAIFKEVTQPHLLLSDCRDFAVMQQTVARLEKEAKELFIDDPDYILEQERQLALQQKDEEMAVIERTGLQMKKQPNLFKVNE